MNSLLPYPTKTEMKNSVECKIPGFSNPIVIPFPPFKLPVCARCKKSFRARSLCRERDGHIAPPWKSAYACIQIDHSCLSTDEQGRYFILNGRSENSQFIARLEEHTAMYKTVHIPEDDDYPMCKRCKEVKNYSRVHCRHKEKHRELPWNVFNMRLYAASHTPQTLPAYSSALSETSMKRNASMIMEAEVTKKPRRRTDVYECESILEVPKSKTFLLSIGSDCSLHVST